MVLSSELKIDVGKKSICTCTDSNHVMCLNWNEMLYRLHVAMLGLWIVHVCHHLLFQCINFVHSHSLTRYWKELGQSSMPTPPRDL